LITIGGCTIDMLGPGPMMVGLHDDKFIEGLKESDCGPSGLMAGQR
jgi:hypothetical protein